jgi:hypothetical protein
MSHESTCLAISSVLGQTFWLQRGAAGREEMRRPPGTRLENPKLTRLGH